MLYLIDRADLRAVSPHIPNAVLMPHSKTLLRPYPPFSILNGPSPNRRRESLHASTSAVFLLIAIGTMYK